MKHRIAIFTVSVHIAWVSLACAETESIHQRVVRLRRELAAAETSLARLEGRATGKVAAEPGKAADTSEAHEWTPFEKFAQGVVVRRSAFDKKQITDPAEISYTRPGHGKESFAIDAGVGVELGVTRWKPSVFNHVVPITMSTNFGVEYHRNSALSSRTDQFETGLRFETAINSGQSDFFALLNGNISYVNDNVAGTRVLKGSVEFLPSIRALKTDDYYDAGSLRWRWAPFAALVYDRTVDRNDRANGGHRLLGRYGAEVQVWPFYKSVGEKVELRGRYTVWSDLDSSGMFKGNSGSTFYEAGVTYWLSRPDPNPKNPKRAEVGIGLTYTNGEDPELGLQNTDQIVLSLQAKF